MAYDSSDGYSGSSLLSLFYNWQAKSLDMPNDMATLFAYALLFLVSWYIVIWVARLVMSLVYPVIIILLALLLFRFLRSLEAGDLVDMIFYAIAIITDVIISVITKVFELLLNSIS